MKKSKIGVLLLSIIFILLMYYFLLPPLNLSSPEFWSFMLLIFIIVVIDYSVINGINMISKRRIRLSDLKPYKVFLIILFGTFSLIAIINFISSPLFNAKEYSSRIAVDETHEFTKDVKLVDFNKIPLLDKESSEKLGDRKMGEATSWVSQFYVSDLYTQINYNDDIVRVTPIEYAGLIKYFTNRSEGIKGYIIVNSVDGKAKLQKIDKGMKYMPSAYFFENLERKLRLSYPTTIFDDASFEIDNEGNPYWIVPVVKYKAIGLKKEIVGAVLLDPITGESKKYDLEDIPKWVDHVYSAKLVIEQLDNWGEFRNGFFNSLFGQKDVINTTDGYNYLVMDDDVYLYTGITSVSTDESNLGFVLVNLRTKETNYYSAPGAEEYSAMASAEGLVQEKKYKASFPLLINLNNKPTYLLSLKDNAGLVKMYAFIDVEDYQKVVVSDASLGIEVAAEKYLGDSITISNEVLKKEIVIKNITSAVIEGNTSYYITDSNNNLYIASIKVNKNLLPFLAKESKVNISYNEGEISQIISISMGEENE